MSLARRAEVQVTWSAVDITHDLQPHLLGLSYTDNLTGAADDLTLDLEDRGGLWSGDWKPDFGDSVEARLRAEPWLTAVADLRLGKFAHDKISLIGPPKRVTIKAVSAPLATGLRRRKRTKAWRKQTLRQIAEDIADRAALTLEWTGSNGLQYARREQKDKSDLEFLEEACKEVGRDLKVTEDKIVIFDEEDRDSAASVGTVHLDNGRVKSWSFDSDDSGRYGSCHVAFFDPRTGKVISAQFPPVSTTPAGYEELGLDPDGQTLEVRLPVDDAGQAEAICKGKLRNANRFATSGHLVVMGDPGLVAGVTFDLEGANKLDGKFIITKATHSPIGGYTCTLDVRRCVETY